MQWGIALYIFFINLIYIFLNTIRTILTMRGYRRIAPIIAMIEITIYILGLSAVMQYLDNPLYLIIYALGYGVGIYVGIYIEDKIALGYTVVQVYVESGDHTLPDALRERGFGVTIEVGYGRDGERLILTILTPRSDERTLYRLINEIEPKAFYYTSDAKYIHGGFWSKVVKNDIIRDQRDEPVSATDEYITKSDYVADDFYELGTEEEEQAIHEAKKESEDLKAGESITKED